MFCQFCGKEHLDGAVVCPHCGMLIEQEVAVSAPVATPVAQPTAAPVAEQPKDVYAFDDRSKKTLKLWIIFMLIGTGISLISWILQRILFASVGIHYGLEISYYLSICRYIASIVFDILIFVSALKQPNKPLKTVFIIWFIIAMFSALNGMLSYIAALDSLGGYGYY